MDAKMKWNSTTVINDYYNWNFVIHTIDLQDNQRVSSCEISTMMYNACLFACLFAFSSLSKVFAKCLWKPFMETSTNMWKTVNWVIHTKWLLPRKEQTWHENWNLFLLHRGSGIKVAIAPPFFEIGKIFTSSTPQYF